MNSRADAPKRWLFGDLGNSRLKLGAIPNGGAWNDSKPGSGSRPNGGFEPNSSQSIRVSGVELNSQLPLVELLGNLPSRPTDHSDWRGLESFWEEHHLGTVSGGSSARPAAQDCSGDAATALAKEVEAWDGMTAGMMAAKGAAAATQDVCVLLSSVASPEVRQSLEAKLRYLGAVEVHWNPNPGLQLDIRHPETVGADRLYAALAAWQRAGQRPVICVDAGTALTVDVVGSPVYAVGRAASVGGEAQAPVFLGGAIAPGPDLLARSIAAGGAQLWKVEPKPGLPALGKETSEALEAGITVGFEGAALHLVRRMAAEAGLHKPVVVLTGGAAPYLRGVLTDLGWGLIEDPNLVLRGLALAGQQVRL